MLENRVYLLDSDLGTHIAILWIFMQGKRAVLRKGGPSDAVMFASIEGPFLI